MTTSRTAALERLLQFVAEMAARPISVSSPGAPGRAALLVAPGFVQALAAVKDSIRSESEVEISALQAEKETLLLALAAQLARVERVLYRVRDIRSEIYPEDELSQAEIAEALDEALAEGKLSYDEEKAIDAKVRILVESIVYGKATARESGEAKEVN